jgi:1-acyl-sn-glycerol-3-phosphate acyltransferase
MIYVLLRWVSGIALHWFYDDISIVGAEKIPVGGPLLIAANHQNALVDSLIVGWLVPRRIAMTAKATLTDNPLTAILFQTLHVVPLRRVSDEVSKQNGFPLDRSRNAQAFEEIFKLLERNGALLIFPEGKSHNEAGLEPLKTGLARVALQASNERGSLALRSFLWASSSKTSLRQVPA